MSAPLPTSTGCPPDPLVPPGMSLGEYLALQGQLVTISISVAVAFGIIAWDYFLLLPNEVALYMGANRQMLRKPTTIAFIVLRYSGILATLPAIFFTSAQSQHCQVAAVISQVGACLAVLSSGAIFCFRVYAMWYGSKMVFALIAVVYIAMGSSWIAVATQYNAATGPPTPLGSNCIMHPIASWAPLSFGSSVLFDTTILVLTLAKLPRNLTQKSSVGSQIFRDTLLYFTLTTTTNIVVLSIQALGSSHAMLKPTAVPFSTVMIVTMGSRVYLNLKLLHQRSQGGTSAGAGGGERIPLSITSSDKNKSITSRDSTTRAVIQRGYSDEGRESTLGKVLPELVLEAEV
ncbi:hypothetical protein GY45DRAFT_725421 [Cubamyces sp. BRFM 1775]|nr:hypothetical protein GY45DRAFT_725421 [Cubamyces sp. BRFM 1775]